MPSLASGQTALEQYERLRREAVRGQLRNGPGLSVLISRGMVALIHLVERIPNHNQSRTSSQSEQGQTLLLQETEKQLVQLLAAMVLGRQQEVVHVC